MEDKFAARPLSGRNSVIFGAGGDVGSSVAVEFAKQGATVHLSGRTLSRVEKVAERVRAVGGKATAAQIDALSERDVDGYLDGLAKEGTLDVVLNLASPPAREYANGTPITDLPLSKFVIPLHTVAVSQFVTSRSAVRLMIKQKSGVLLFLTAVPSQGITPEGIAIGAAFGAVESMVRTFARGLGPQGIRAVCVRSGPMVDTRTIQETMAMIAKAQGLPTEKIAAGLQAIALAKAPNTTEDTAKILAFLASDAGKTITGAIINTSGGRMLD
jgi:3-oxoacyl-[acyl-carrier protein] reductase